MIPKLHPHEKPHHPHWPLAVLLGLFVLLLGLASVHDEGTWLHIRTGSRIVQEGRLPKTEIYSYTASGRPWTTVSWLSDVLMAWGHAQAGPRALVAGKAVVLAAAFALLLPLNPGSPILAAGVLAVGAFAAWPGFVETPAALDFLFLALLIRLLRPRGGFSWSLPLAVGALTALWANLHGSAAALGVWLAALKVFKTSLRTTARERLRYLGVLVAAAAGFGFNPHGLGLFAQALGAAEPTAGSWAGAGALQAAFLAAGLAACWVCLQQEFFLTVTAASLMALSLVVPAFRAPAMLAVCPVVALALGHALAPRGAGPWRMFRLGLGLAGLFALHWLTVYEPLGASRGYAAVSLDGALQYLSANGVKGRGFNDIEAGAHLIGGSERPVFVDGRLELYGDSFVRDARDWPSRFAALSGVYGFDYAVLRNRRASYPARAIDESPDWRLAYADDAALVYLRRGGANQWLVPEAGSGALRPNRLWPDGLDAALRDPRRLPKLMDELDRWLVQAPDCAQALLWKAYALERMKLSQKASRLLDLAATRRTLRRDPELRAQLAFVHESAGRDQPALGLYAGAAQAARRRGDAPLETAVLERLSPLYRRLGESARAAAAQRRLAELSKAAVPS